jgi:hypothetical protein
MRIQDPMNDQVRVLFCGDPTSPRRPDPLYEAEYAAAQEVGIPCDLVDFESLVYERDADRAVRRVTTATEPTLGVFRGWMMRPELYGALYVALEARGVRLVNDPDAYALCHHLPNWYPVLERWTPKSVWLRIDGDVSADELAAALLPFDGGPVIVKDFVKSQKHHWDEACFIPSSADLANAERVVRSFLELQGPDVNEGLVFREFEQFVPLTSHSRSGMPLTREYRLFFLDGDPILTSEYWEEGEYEGPGPPLDELRAVAARISSRFFTMDVAQRRDGRWRIVELGDGQVAGLPKRTDPLRFFSLLIQSLGRAVD